MVDQAISLQFQSLKCESVFNALIRTEFNTKAGIRIDDIRKNGVTCIQVQEEDKDLNKTVD